MVLNTYFTAVTMKDDILTAVACSDYSSAQTPVVAQNVAPIAPLPSRLSFCLSPQRQQQLDTMMNTTESIVDQETTETEVIISPTKKLLNCAGGEAISTMAVAVKRSPTVAPSVVPRLVAKTTVEAAVVVTEAEVNESPAKRKLRMSVSCDNYLGDGKFSLTRRDSVGSGSPHSSKVRNTCSTFSLLGIREKCRYWGM